MLAWDYSIFSIVIVTFPVVLVFAIWIIYTLTKANRLSDYTGSRLKQCPFCTYLCVSFQQEVIQRCPCCDSFYESEG